MYRSTFSRSYTTIVDACPGVALMIRLLVIVISVLLSGCTGSSSSSTDVAIAASIDDYDAAVAEIKNLKVSP